MRAFRRNLRLPGTALRVLLMLGMVVNPVLAAVGELHGMEHASLAAGGEAHDHDHAHTSHIQPHDHRGGGDDPDHATGGHGLLHQVVGGTDPLPDSPLRISMQPACGLHLPECSRCQLPGDSPDLPFRPPIA
jgi:hypothetical protein